MSRLQKFQAVCLFMAACGTPALGQSPLSPELAAQVSNAMDHAESSGQLHCHTQTFHPFLDFALRFESGFVISCDLQQFQGRATRLATYLRATPRGGKPVLFGDSFELPKLPEPQRASIAWKHFHSEVEFSGVVALGEGEYEMELLLVAQNNLIHRKRWTAKAEARGKEKSVEPTLPPNTVSATSFPPWQHGTSLAPAANRRVTVLLDAAPLYPASLKLRAWDRAFLLGSLASLLRQLGAAQVRLVAFNLDQPREIFREDNFNRHSFRQLTGALQNLELGTVSYRTLQRQNGWADLLVKLVNEEIASPQPSDAVIFLGPTSRILDKIETGYIRTRADLGQRLYYFEYFTRIGYEFPDTIHQLTNACKGTVFKLHSPGDFAASIAKLQHRLDADATSAP